MSLLGVALPNLRGRQIGIDLFPEPLKKSKKAIRSLGSPLFEEFLLVHLPSLDQRNLWDVFQRVLRMSEEPCWDTRLSSELLLLSCDEITPPRNRFLYKASFWPPLGDLTEDVDIRDLNDLFGTELDAEDPGFLLRLSFSVYRIFEQALADLAEHSAIIKEQLHGSRVISASELPESFYYKGFLSHVCSQGGSE